MWTSSSFSEERTPAEITVAMNIEDDYSSIASELMRLEQHERTVRKDLAGIYLEDYDENDDDETVWPDSCNGMAQCGLVVDDDDDEDLYATPRKKRSSFLGNIPSALLSISPFRSSTRTLATATTEDDDDSIFDIPEVISYATRKAKAGLKDGNKTAWSGFGFRNQISKSDFMQLQRDLETALTDVSSYLDSTTVTDDIRTTGKEKKPNELLQQVVFRLAEHLYGDPKDNSFEAKVCAMFLARSDIPLTWKRQRLEAAK